MIDSNNTNTDSRQSKLAVNLCEIHGQGHVAQGRSGPVLYVACPSCLETYGKRELNSRHLSILLERAVSGTKFPIAYCMKHSAHKFTLSDLFCFPPVSTRVPGYVKSSVSLESPVETKHPLMKHESGIEVPFPPGETIPLSELPEEHVALWYLRSRNYNPVTLEKQFNACYCVKETPCTKENGLFYRRWEDGFKDTPQGRIIFHAMINGISRGWQGRLIDDTYDELGIYSVLHPYTGRWVEVGSKETGELVYYPAFQSKLRPLSKYRNAIGFLSGNVLFGYDSFLDRNKNIPFDDRVAVLTEGPLDAARFPSNGLAYTRAHVSPAQARMASTLAPTVVLAYDNDEASLKSFERNMEVLSEHCRTVLHISPKPYKDFGEAGIKFSAKTLNAILQ